MQKPSTSRYIFYSFSQFNNTKHLFKLKWSGIWTLGQKTWWLWGLLISRVDGCLARRFLSRSFIAAALCLSSPSMSLRQSCQNHTRMWYSVYRIQYKYIIWYSMIHTYRYSIEACYIQMRSASMCSARYICVGFSVISVETRLPYWWRWRTRRLWKYYGNRLKNMPKL